MELSKYKYPLYIKHGGLTHPDIAKPLVDPLFAARKEGAADYRVKFNILKSPLYAKGEERVVQRSADRVSKIYERKEGVALFNLSNGA